MPHTLLILAALVIGTSAVVAQTTNPVQERNALMNAMWRDAWRSVTRMVEGKEPFDQATASAAFARVTELSVKARPLWPEKAKGAAPKASFASSPKVWTERKQFDAYFAQLEKQSTEWAPKVTSLETLKAAFDPVNKTCDDCHEVYRIRTR